MINLEEFETIIRDIDNVKEDIVSLYMKILEKSTLWNPDEIDFEVLFAVLNEQQVKEHVRKIYKT